MQSKVLQKRTAGTADIPSDVDILVDEILSTSHEFIGTNEVLTLSDDLKPSVAQNISTDSCEIPTNGAKGVANEEQVSIVEAENGVVMEHYSKVVEGVLSLGPVLFLQHMQEQGVKPVDIATALGQSIPKSLLEDPNQAVSMHSDDDDGVDYVMEGQWHWLRQLLFRYFYERPRISSLESVDDAVELIRTAQRIMVVTGAGISVSSGIPDFRSPGGLYDRVRQRYALPQPECMFDLEYFLDDPEPFFSFAHELLPDPSDPQATIHPSPSHRFIASLERQNKLLRQFTQNIDTLEDAAGISKVVYCHGSFSTSTCLECRKKYNRVQLQQAMSAGVQSVPRCVKCDGLIKPDIVFFGESIPMEYDQHIHEDSLDADLLIVMGSSLKVHPVSSIPDLIPPGVPQILINRESLDHTFDIELLGDCDAIVSYLASRLYWDQVDEWWHQQSLDGSSACSWHQLSSSYRHLFAPVNCEVDLVEDSGQDFEMTDGESADGYDSQVDMESPVRYDSEVELGSADEYEFVMESADDCESETDADEEVDV